MCRVQQPLLASPILPRKREYLVVGHENKGNVSDTFDSQRIQTVIISRVVSRIVHGVWHPRSARCDLCSRIALTSAVTTQQTEVDAGDVCLGHEEINEGQTNNKQNSTSSFLLLLVSVRCVKATAATLMMHLLFVRAD